MSSTMLDDEIAAAELAVVEAQAHPALDGVEVDDYARAQEAERLAAMVDRTRRVRLAQAEVERLRAAKAAQGRAVVDHAEAERKQAKQIDRLPPTLAASRVRVAEAAVAAEKALTALVDTCRGHDQLVRDTAATLRQGGLSLYSEGVEFETGGGESSDGAVRLRGQWWLPVPADRVMLRAVWAAARRCFGDRDPLTAAVADRAGFARLASRPDNLLAGAPLPAALPAAPSVWQHPEVVEALARHHERPPAGLSDPAGDELAVLRRAARRQVEGR